MTPCECTFTGDGRTSWCARHQCAKTAHYHKLCQTQPAYFQLWEEGRGPGQNSGRKANPAEHVPCLHRGAEIRREECGACAGRVLVKIFACPLHGECSPAKELSGVACCAICTDYYSPQVIVPSNGKTQDKPEAVALESHAQRHSQILDWGDSP